VLGFFEVGLLVVSSVPAAAVGGVGVGEFFVILLHDAVQDCLVAA